MSVQHTMLKVIERRKAQIVELNTKRDKKEIPEALYWNLFHTYKGAIDTLYMCLTTHDNPLSEFCVNYKPEPKKNKKA